MRLALEIYAQASSGLSVVFQALVICMVFSAAGEASAQSIVLRNLSRIYPAAIQSLDGESLTLAGGEKVTWDRVLQVDVDADWQQRIEQKVREIGEPLYRLKYRLQQNNVAGAYEIARQWYQQEDRSFSGVQANFMVCRAIMLGRLEGGERAAAIEPMLQALILQQQCEQGFLDSLPHIAFAPDELKAGIHEGFLPVWSSQEEAAPQLKRLFSGFDLDEQVARWPGLAVYLCSLSIHAQQRERAPSWGLAMQGVPQLRRWQGMLNKRFSRMTLPTLTAGLEDGLRVAALYCWASDREQQAAKSDRVLALLKIVANDGERYPRVAKLALARSIELTEDPKVRKVLQAELMPSP